MLRPTWTEVDLTKFNRNLAAVKKQIGPDVRLLLVLKANAYGHGAAALGAYAEERRLCDFFGAASVEEALALRQAGLKTPILVLGSIYPFDAFEYAIKNNIALTIASLDAAKAVKEIAQKLGVKAFCHVKQDTGMGRIGTRRGGVMNIIETLAGDEHIVLDGLFTHLSSVDTDEAFTEEQIGYFRDTLAAVRLKNIRINHCHMAASPAVRLRADSYCDMVRTGHGAFGLEEGFEPILSLKTRIVYTKDVPAGFSLSYNRSFVADKPMKVATVPLGYGDGYLRALSNKAEMLIQGKRCRVLGNITMDMTMVDISSVPQARVGEEVTVFGRQGADEIRVSELAQKAGTIDYELTTLLMPRVPRIYTE